MSADLLVRGATSEGASGWGDLQGSFKPIGYARYRDYHVYIYESLDAERPGLDKGRVHYFYTPVLLLEPETAEYQYLTMENKHAVSFDVTMWNEEVENTVIEFMQEKLKMNVERERLRPIPFERLMLTSRSSSDAGACRCPNEWVSYQLHKKKAFNLICPTKEKAVSIAAEMRAHPKRFEGKFEMKLKLSTRQTGRQGIAISLEHALDSDLFSKLNQEFPKASEVLLTAEDTTKLLAEATNNVAIHSFTEDVVMSSEHEKGIYSILKYMLVSGEKTIDSHSGRLWDSVFWHEDNCRPDRIASELNESTKKCDRETQKIIKHVVDQAGKGGFSDQLASLFSKNVASLGSDSKQGASGAVTWLAPLGTLMSFAAPYSGLAGLLGGVLFLSSNRWGSRDKADVEASVKKFAETVSKVEWNGEKFVPKPMTLTRINLASVRNRQNWMDKKISVSRSSDVFGMSVNVNLDASPSYNSYYDDLKRQLSQLDERINKLALSFEEKLTSHKRELCARMGHLEQFAPKELLGLRPYHWRDWCVARGVENLYIWCDAAFIELYDGSSFYNNGFYFLIDDALRVLFQDGTSSHRSHFVRVQVFSRFNVVRSKIYTNKKIHSRALFPRGTTSTTPLLTFGNWVLSSSDNGAQLTIQHSTTKPLAIILREDLRGFMFETITGTIKKFAAKSANHGMWTDGWTPS